MNVSDLFTKNPSVLTMHNKKSNALNAQKETLLHFAKATLQTTKEGEKKSKSEKVGMVHVSSADERQRLIQVRAALVSKVGEVLGSDENKKTKELRVQMLQRQIEEIDKMIAQIDREKRMDSKEKRQQKDGIWIKKSDLDHLKGNESIFSPAVEILTPNLLNASLSTLSVSTIQREVDVSL